jgi:mRNA-degrading endonuclease HigB of HigAB toxin-antitoxin module
VYCDCVVFDIKGNDYGLITIILYSVKHVYVRHVLTHAEYDSRAGFHYRPGARRRFAANPAEK